MAKSQKNHEVGQEISTLCNKCKSEMVHVITTVKDGKIKKLLTCLENVPRGTFVSNLQLQHRHKQQNKVIHLPSIPYRGIIYI